MSEWERGSEWEGERERERERGGGGGRDCEGGKRKKEAHHSLPAAY